MKKRQGHEAAADGQCEDSVAVPGIFSGPVGANVLGVASKEIRELPTPRSPYQRRAHAKGRDKNSGSGSDARAQIYSALDLGTNNCRLLVAKPSRESFKVIDAFSRIVRLGEGLARSQVLSQEAMDRALSALYICAKKMRSRGVTRSRCVAT